ncbi:MAG TPA: TatD family hydrolase [Cellvibrionaceae bacterium]
MIVDSHCHLDRLDLTAHQQTLAQLIAQAHACGVAGMLCVCISEENKDAVLSIAAEFDCVVASVGAHPSDVKDQVIDVDTLIRWAQAPKVVALGETGLDYYYSADFASIQQESFKNHLIAGAQLKLPVIVHTRQAQQDTLSLMSTFADQNSAGVMHCFTEDWAMAKAALDMNFYISISGIVTFKNAADLREVVKKIPLDRLLIETDSPYLAPIPYRGKSNIPQYVCEVADYIAELRGIEKEELYKTTSANFLRLFNKAAEFMPALVTYVNA